MDPVDKQRGEWIVQQINSDNWPVNKWNTVRVLTNSGGCRTGRRSSTRFDGFQNTMASKWNQKQGEEGNSPQQGLHKHQTQPQSEDLNITQINIHQTTEIAVNDVLRTEEGSEHHRPQQTEMIGENIQEQIGQVSQNHTDESTRGTIENNAGNTANINLNNDQHNIAGNNTNVPQVPEYESENSQNHPRVGTQQNVNTPQHTVQTQNQNEFSENSCCSLNQFNLMEPKTQRPQKNGRVRRNIMRGRNNTQNWELQDVRLWETSRNHQQSNWWSTNQPDTTSYLQLPPRKFQEQRRHVVNYEEEEDLSWCNKCGELGHIWVFCTARVFCSFCRMRSHNNKALWNQQWNERLEPFSSSRQMAPIQNPVQQGQKLAKVLK